MKVAVVYRPVQKRNVNDLRPQAQVRNGILCRRKLASDLIAPFLLQTCLAGQLGTASTITRTDEAGIAKHLSPDNYSCYALCPDLEKY